MRALRGHFHLPTGRGRTGRRGHAPMGTAARRERSRAGSHPTLPADAALLGWGGWMGVGTYSIKLPAKNDVPPEVWFASAIWADTMAQGRCYGAGLVSGARKPTPMLRL